MQDDYSQRINVWGLDSKEVIKNAIDSDPRTVFVDVRSPQEIEGSVLESRPYIHAWCTMSDASRVTEKIPAIVTDKSVPIVVYCAVGGRAAVAKKALEALGYDKVLNGGGLKDLDYV